MKHSKVPFSMRKFTLDGEPCDIEDFISANATSFEDARFMRSDLEDLGVGYHMYFRFDGSPTEREIFRIA